jgi:hypothetical protein
MFQEWLKLLDLTKMSRVELLALAHGLTVMLKLNPNVLIAVDEKGDSFAVYSVPDRKPVKRTFLMRLLGVPDCVDVCGQNLKRRHGSCGVCRWPKIIKGKLPPVVPVTVYFLAMGKDRRFEKLQSWMGKKVTALLEIIQLYGEQNGGK